jgi:hypothetical protein
MKKTSQASITVVAVQNAMKKTSEVCVCVCVFLASGSEVGSCKA